MSEVLLTDLPVRRTKLDTVYSGACQHDTTAAPGHAKTGATLVLKPYGSVGPGEPRPPRPSAPPASPPLPPIIIPSSPWTIPSPPRPPDPPVPPLATCPPTTVPRFAVDGAATAITATTGRIHFNVKELRSDLRHGGLVKDSRHSLQVVDDEVVWPLQASSLERSESRISLVSHEDKRFGLVIPTSGVDVGSELRFDCIERQLAAREVEPSDVSAALASARDILTAILAARRVARVYVSENPSARRTWAASLSAAP